MKQHLSREEAKLLSMYQLNGQLLVRALSHIEICKKCRNHVNKLNSLTKTDVAKKLLTDDTSQILNSKS